MSSGVDDALPSQRCSRGHTLALDDGMASSRHQSGLSNTAKRPLSDYSESDNDADLLEAASLASRRAAASPATPTADIEDSVTDYGSDFDSEGEAELAQLLADLAGAPGQVTEPIEEDVIGRRYLVQIPRLSSSPASRSFHAATEKVRSSPPISRVVPKEAARDDDPSQLPTVAREIDNKNGSLPRTGSGALPAEVPADAQKEDLRTPIERFRQLPKKPLSVTDVVSPAWCELQYWYSLTKFGRVRRTPAMKQGSKVHKELEEQVHTYVEVDVTTKEDIYGLRMWNIIQGLRTLRATGMTRELELWGVLDGEVINGIVDELSTTCPDPELEHSINISTGEAASRGLPASQTIIPDFYKSQEGKQSDWAGRPEAAKTVFLTDVKTRAAKRLPTGASLRPVKMQLMLYHRLLCDLASNLVPADTIFSRYRLDPHASFTHTFMRNIADLDGDFMHSSELDLDNAEAEIVRYNTLTTLWSLMITEFSLTIPSASTVSPILQAEYRKAKDGAVLGNQCFVYDAKALDQYVSKTMDWWKGRRDARGVDVEEAFKCKVCEFAENCEWRKGKLEEGIKRSREKNAAGGKRWKV